MEKHVTIMTHNGYGTSRELDSIIAGLQHLLMQYRDLLREEGMKSEVERLLGWMGRMEAGEWRLESRVSERSLPILAVLYEKLSQSADDYARMEEESPATGNARQEAKAVRFAEASVEVQSIIRLLLETFESHQ